jgi:2-C-methyl-D-erythritol 4-phosphate cytidylyltransferase
VYDDDADVPAPLGMVPVDGRGSWPFALFHGESLVAVASWALGESGAELVDFTASWEWVRDSGRPLVVHDPLCPGTPVSFLAEALAAAADGAVVVGVRPVTDTVRHVEDADPPRLGATADREDLLAVASPVVIPARVLATLDEAPSLDDLAELVVALRADHEVHPLEAPASARRVVDESDLRVLEALVPER